MDKKITQQQIETVLQAIWQEGVKTTTFDAIQKMFSGLETIKNEEDKKAKK
jgi:hypothetical protein